jgi:hypothetical protein
MNSARAVLLALAVALSAASASAADIKTAEGRISDIDWAGSKIVVRWLSQDDNVFHDIAITIPDEAKLMKGANEIDFSELEISDDVTVKYYEDLDGNAALISLSVTNPD